MMTDAQRYSMRGMIKCHVGWYMFYGWRSRSYSLSTSSLAQTNSKINGVVMARSTREPLPAASIRIEGLPLGAHANERGEFFILNEPIGNYTLICIVIGCAPLRIEGVMVSSDITTNQNFELDSTVL
ncbi:MAG TPA: carboxypeptidase-like regulatory domain-containing protein [candidate division Zixibacteria bacterium]|nr:carboxypeptidase-like regulatory domain-containing protein [candidate division Zixibacteria bacterium]